METVKLELKRRKLSVIDQERKLALREICLTKVGRFQKQSRFRWNDLNEYSINL